MLKLNFRIFLAGISGLFFLSSFSQVNSLEPNDKEKKFNPYMYWRHGGIQGLADFKKDHNAQYLNELWYYSESFYIKRNHLNEGVSLDESIIDISRFESNRKESDESVVVLPGFKDALVLLPRNKLVFKPDSK